MIGATVSLLFAVALLSDKFFGGTGGKLTEGVEMSWLRLVAFGALTGLASRQFLPGLSERIKKLVAKQVTERTAAVRREVETRMGNQLELARSQTEIAQLAAAPAAAVPVAAGGGDPLARLAELAAEYLNINAPQQEDRVAARMRVAAEMLAVINAGGITSEALAGRIQAPADRALLVALASLIAARPQPGDARRLFDALDRALPTPDVQADSKFILYRALLAVVSLKDNRRLPADQAHRARALAEACLAIADESLRKKARAVLDLLG